MSTSLNSGWGNTLEVKCWAAESMRCWVGVQEGLLEEEGDIGVVPEGREGASQ